MEKQSWPFLSSATVIQVKKKKEKFFSYLLIWNIHPSTNTFKITLNIFGLQNNQVSSIKYEPWDSWTEVSMQSRVKWQ